MNTETLLLEFNEDEILVEKIKNKKYYISGIYSTFNECNGNKRYYPESVMKPEIERLIEDKVSKGGLTGELDHPEKIGVSLRNASHKIEELSINGNHVYGRSLVLETTTGRDLQALIEAKVLIGISSRGTGKTKFDEKRNLFRVETLKLRTWDIVSNPSNYYSHLKSLYESEYGPLNSLQEKDKQKINEEIKNKLEIYSKLSNLFIKTFK